MTDHLYLAHHGIKGMKWGVRRFQNADGSLTAAGEKRYSGGNDKKRERLSNNVKASKEFVSATKRMANRAEARAANSNNVLVKGVNKIEAAHQRGQQRMWEREAKRDQRRLEKYDKQVEKKRNRLETSVENARELAAANKRMADRAIERAKNTKVGIIAPGIGLAGKGLQYIEANHAQSQQRMWEREAEKSQRQLDKYNAKHS